MAEASNNGWALYGIAWALSATRILHATLGVKDEEILRLRTENTQLLNRLLKRQSTEPMPVNGEPQNGHNQPSVRREFKPPIAAHNAQAKAAEDTMMRQRREAEKREQIRRDAERQTV